MDSSIAERHLDRRAEKLVVVNDEYRRGNRAVRIRHCRSRYFVALVDVVDGSAVRPVLSDEGTVGSHTPGVDDCCARDLRGRSMRTVNPGRSGSAGAICRRPPWRVTSSWQTARPIPSPTEPLPLIPRRITSCSWPGGIPGPSSWIRTRTMVSLIRYVSTHTCAPGACRSQFARMLVMTWATAS